MDTRKLEPLQLIEQMINDKLLSLNTCIPGKIISFDAATQTCSVTPAVKRKRVSNDGNIEFIDLPTIAHVPICFPYSGNASFALTIPVTANDPCLIIFSQRNIDNWHEHGGIQNPEDDGPGVRHHHINDCFVLAGAPSLIDVLSSYITDGMEIRNKARTTRITVKDDYAEVVKGSTSVKVEATKITATSGSSTLVLNSDGTVTLNATTITVTGATTFASSVKFNSSVTTSANIDLTSHVHYAPHDAGNTGVPI